MNAINSRSFFISGAMEDPTQIVNRSIGNMKKRINGPWSRERSTATTYANAVKGSNQSHPRGQRMGTQLFHRSMPQSHKLKGPDRHRDPRSHLREQRDPRPESWRGAPNHHKKLLTGANSTPLGFHFSSSLNQQQNFCPIPKSTDFDRLRFPRSSVLDRLSFPLPFQPVQNLNLKSAASLGHLNLQWRLKARCSRCQVLGHSAINCHGPTHCAKCNVRGHVAQNCRRNEGNKGSPSDLSIRLPGTLR